MHNMEFDYALFCPNVLDDNPNKSIGQCHRFTIDINLCTLFSDADTFKKRMKPNERTCS